MGDLPRAFRRDLEDVYHFYLDDKAREELAGMGKTSRWFYMIAWLLKNSFLKLSPVRRILLVASVIFFLEGAFNQINIGALIVGFAMLAFILLLELKDKLLAQDELQAGRAVQFALMPKDNPKFRGWDAWVYTRPANDVGGDLVDYIPVRENSLGVVLGDVAGKGLPAALYMAKLQATLRAIAPNYDSLSDLGCELNRIFCRDGLPDRFVSMLYLEIEAEGSGVRILNAGHFPPVILRKEGIRELAKGAPALGLTPLATYKEQRTTLEVGDVLLVYSDGLTEARNEQGVFFERTRLAALLKNARDYSAEEVGERLLAAVDAFIGDARPSDDLSLIVLKRTAVNTSLEPRSHRKTSVLQDQE